MPKNSMIVSAIEAGGISLDADSAAQIDAILESARNQPGALLPILHAIQHALGFIPPGSVALIAANLNLSRAEVHGVITFYHHFRDRKSTRLNSSHVKISYAVFCLKKKTYPVLP